jgi:branched-chain amino acid transport system permease protein
MLVFLIIYSLRADASSEGEHAGGPLDQALKPAGQTATTMAASTQTQSWVGSIPGVIPFVILAFVPFILRGSAYWLGLVATGLCFSIMFLTFTVVTGEGGMLWLSQPVFAGMGAIAAAQFVLVWHVPVLLAIVFGGALAAVVGAVMGVLTIRLGQLYVALGTLTFGLLVESLVFSQDRYSQLGAGVTVSPPGWAGGTLAFCYLALAVFGVFALLIVNLRRSTSGIALTAVRDSEPASRTLGLSVVQLKIIVGALAAFVAAVGGGFVAINAGAAVPTTYDTFLGLFWLAIVVTLGIRSILAAALSGLAFILLPAVFQNYAPASWVNVPQILFGLGAVMVALNPDGVVVMNGRWIRRGATLLTQRHREDEAPVAAEPDAVTVGVAVDR